MEKKKLFESSDDEDDSEEIWKIEIDEEFARRNEHNKEREELQRLTELKKKGVLNVESEDNSEEDCMIPSKDDLKKFYVALTKVKQRDPSIYLKDAKLYESEDDEKEEKVEEEEEEENRWKKPKMYLKDVQAKHLLEQGPEFVFEEGVGSKSMSYMEEQEELRRELLNFADETIGVDDDGELFKYKRRDGEEDKEEGDSDGETHKMLLDGYFGVDKHLDDKGLLLKEYFRVKGWKQEDKKLIMGKEDWEDEEEVEKQEMYEAKFNFRYEEGAGDRVLGHARFNDGTVRKKTNARKLQRKRKEERMALADFHSKENVKRFKNLKMKEIKDKFGEILATAGIPQEGGACALNEDDLEEDFDPEEHDRKMNETFDVGYYNAEDVEPGFCSNGDDNEIPYFDEENELLGLSKGDGFSAVRENILRCFANNKDDGHCLHQVLEEYFKLDYEGRIGDLKTRFKYTSVRPQRYGLNSAEIMNTNDKDLNQFVPLKRLAPYGDEWKVSNRKRHNLKIKSKLVGKRLRLTDQRTDRKHTSKVEGPNVEAGTESRRSKRKRRQAELKLSQPRLLAYGKISAKSKNKKRH